mmetsp:Transcript_96768/g.282916  ORF Transcript_96768/g.282916 Transcript_96768/m.282916 type:complete len:109 (+) Transcript_96768:41-367(+)
MPLKLKNHTPYGDVRAQLEGAEAAFYQIKVLLNGEEEVVDVDARSGPRVRTGSENDTLQRPIVVTSHIGAGGIVGCPIAFEEMTITEKECTVIIAAKKNRGARLARGG